MKRTILTTREILLIDDDIDELELFADALRGIDQNFSCSQVKSYAEALNYLQHTIPDFIFIDFNMPVTDGFHCLTELRKLVKLENTIIIIYSNYISESFQLTATTLGATGCMKKSNTNLDLVQKLKEILKYSTSISPI